MQPTENKLETVFKRNTNITAILIIFFINICGNVNFNSHNKGLCF